MFLTSRLENWSLSTNSQTPSFLAATSAYEAPTTYGKKKVNHKWFFWCCNFHFCSLVCFCCIFFPTPNHTCHFVVHLVMNFSANVPFGHFPYQAWLPWRLRTQTCHYFQRECLQIVANYQVMPKIKLWKYITYEMFSIHFQRCWQG